MALPSRSADRPKRRQRWNVSDGNHLAAVDPRVAQEADGWDPRTISPGSKKQLGWKCAAGHTWTDTPCARTHPSVQTGWFCRTCVPRGGGGFKDAEPGWLYLVAGTIRSEWVIQYGITGRPTQRLHDHALVGFEAELVLLAFRCGSDARALETRLKNLMRTHQVPSCRSQGFTFSGSTEAFVVRQAPSAFLLELVSALKAGGSPAETRDLDKDLLPVLLRRQL